MEKLFKKHLSEETKNKMRETRKKTKERLGYYHTEETKKKISLTKLGKPMFFSEQHRLNLSKANTGKHLSEEAKQKISLWNKGKTYEEKYGPEKAKEIRMKISNSDGLRKKKGTYIEKFGEEKAKEIIGRMRNNLLGRISWNKGLENIYSEETLRKIGDSRRGKISPMSGKKHTEETRIKIKEKRKNQIFPKVDTYIEKKIQEFLKVLGIDFYTHCYINQIKHGYQCDILVPSLNMVIECDGDYWHKYPIGNDLDHIRTKELIEKGFKVLRLWEYEIKNMDLEQFKQKLQGDNLNEKQHT
jgi:very-short-patch-repair endonuclease